MQICIQESMIAKEKGKIQNNGKIYQLLQDEIFFQIKLIKLQEEEKVCKRKKIFHEGFKLN